MVLLGNFGDVGGFGEQACLQVVVVATAAAVFFERGEKITSEVDGAFKSSAPGGAAPLHSFASLIFISLSVSVRISLYPPFFLSRSLAYCPHSLTHSLTHTHTHFLTHTRSLSPLTGGSDDASASHLASKLAARHFPDQVPYHTRVKKMVVRVSKPILAELTLENCCLAERIDFWQQLTRLWHGTSHRIHQSFFSKAST